MKRKVEDLSAPECEEIAQQVDGVLTKANICTEAELMILTECIAYALAKRMLCGSCNKVHYYPDGPHAGLLEKVNNRVTEHITNSLARYASPMPPSEYSEDVEPRGSVH